jgi:hypothetical protein
VLQHEQEVAEAQFVSVGNLPRLKRFEHGDLYPLEAIDYRKLEPLAAAAIRAMQASSDGSLQVMLAMAGFGEVPLSGAGRPGRRRDPDALIAARARSALSTPRGRTNEQQKAVQRARDKELLANQTWTPKGEALLANVDHAKQELQKLLKDADTLTDTDFLPPLARHGIDCVDAAIEDLTEAGEILPLFTDDATRKRTGSRYASIAVRYKP